MLTFYQRPPPRRRLLCLAHPVEGLLRYLRPQEEFAQLLRAPLAGPKHGASPAATSRGPVSEGLRPK